MVYMSERITVQAINHNDVDAPARYIADYLRNHLEQSNKILWFVSGGSSIQIAAQVQELLTDVLGTDLLDVLLIDERYGLIGHDNSNFEELVQAGFDAETVTTHPILNEKEITKTANEYSDFVQTLLHDADAAIGLFGVGSDGHTAGLLPYNPLMESQLLYGAYDAKDFQRITATPKLIRLLDEAVIYAVGKKKWPALQTMQQNGSVDEVPARILKQAKKLTIFSDYKEG